MTGVAAFTHVDVTTGQFQRGVGTHAVTGFPVGQGLTHLTIPNDGLVFVGFALVLHGVIQVEQRNNFHRTGNGDQDGQHEYHQEDITFVLILKLC